MYVYVYIYYDEAIHQRISKMYIWVYAPRLRLVYIYPPQQIKNLQYIYVLYVCMYPYCIYSYQPCVQHLYAIILEHHNVYYISYEPHLGLGFISGKLPSTLDSGHIYVVYT